jgi:hypothetical protein
MGSTPRGISASRGAAILGMSQYQTPLGVWQQIMEEREPGFNAAHGYTLPEREESAAMRWGTAFESAIIGLAERARGEKIIGRELLYATDGNDKSAGDIKDGHFITCHIDGFYNEEYADPKSLVTLHEGKTTNARSFFRNVKDYENSTAFDMWGEPGTDKIPRPYQIQVQHQMLCTGAEQCIVSVLIFPETPDAWERDGMCVILQKDGTYTIGKGGRALDCSDIADMLSFLGFFHQYPVAASVTAQKALAGKYRDFWNSHVIPGRPPEPRNFDDVKRLFPEPKTTIIVPEYIERKLSEYKMIVEETAQAKKQKERIKTIAAKYAAKHGGTLDDESREAVIFRNSSGKKLGQWTKKSFRVS